MSAMTTGFSLLIDPNLNSKPEIRKAIDDAMAFLETQPNFTAENLTASWRLDPPNGTWVEFALSERDGTASLTTRRLLPLHHLTDPVNRDIWVLRVWGDLLAIRSKRRMTRIDQLISELEEDERHGSAVAQ